MSKSSLSRELVFTPRSEGGAVWHSKTGEIPAQIFLFHKTLSSFGSAIGSGCLWPQKAHHACCSIDCSREILPSNVCLQSKRKGSNCSGPLNTGSYFVVVHTYNVLTHGFSSNRMEQKNNEHIFTRKEASEKVKRLEMQWDKSHLQMQN